MNLLVPRTTLEKNICLVFICPFSDFLARDGQILTGQINYFTKFMNSDDDLNIIIDLLVVLIRQMRSHMKAKSKLTSRHLF